MTTRPEFLALALEQMGKPYLWGSKGPDAFDCSGLVSHCLFRVGGPDWRAFGNTDYLLTHLPATEDPKPGDLCLYGPSETDANHVMIWLGACGLVFGASNGNSDCTTLEIARTRRAFVKTKSSRFYRPGFLGFRSLAQYLKE